MADTRTTAREVTLKRELDGIITQMHSAGVTYTDAVKQFKRRFILEVLAHHKGNQCKAAEELGMHRNTLSRTLAELDLDTSAIRHGMRRPVVSERPAAASNGNNTRTGTSDLPTRPRLQSIVSAR